MGIWLCSLGEGDLAINLPPAIGFFSGSIPKLDTPQAQKEQAGASTGKIFAH